ncbi:hypothetical protein [Thermococcus sp.]
MKKLVALVWISLLLGALVVTPKTVKAEDTNWWVKSVQLANARAVAVAPNGDIIINGNHFLLRLSPNGEHKLAVKFKGGDIKLLSDGTTVLTEVNDYNSFHVARFNIDQVPQYSGWLWDEKLSPQVQDTDAHVEDTNAEMR